MLQSLPAALERQAAADPESPFLFWPEGWNWRWWSWRQVAALTARWSAPLAGLGAGAGAAVAFAGDAYPQAVALDLAVQAAGLTPVPLSGGGAAAGQDFDVGAVRQAAVQAGAVAWLEAAAGEARVTRLGGEAASGSAAGGDPGVLVDDEGGGGRRRAAVELLAAAARVESASGAAAGVEGATGSTVLRDESAFEATAGVERGAGTPAPVAGVIGVPAGSRRGSRDREILVAGWPLREWAGRLLAAWAVAAGAALVLEADPARRLGTVLWARPTVFHGGAAEGAALRLQIEARRQPHRWHGWRRLPAPPLGRLRTLFQPEPPVPAEAAFWQECGARLLRLPEPGDAARPVRPGVV
ncbi:MAG TPA: AMP-binding protein [Thermoanaerobaculia bacterium]|nr:AMP-binding protein [Thermoanaerobaculia bacterium]